MCLVTLLIVVLLGLLTSFNWLVGLGVYLAIALIADVSLTRYLRKDGAALGRIGTGWRVVPVFGLSFFVCLLWPAFPFLGTSY